MSSPDHDDTLAMIDRILSDAVYIMGPVHPTQDASVDTTSGELPSFLQVTEGGFTYPREHPGSYFVKQLGVKTWSAYLGTNPEGLKSGRRWYILRKDGPSSYTTVYTGTMIRQQVPSPQQARQTPTEGLADGGAAQRVAAAPPHHQENGNRGAAPRYMIDDLIESLRNDLRSERERSDRLSQQISDLSTRIVEAERLRITAEAQLDVERKRHEGETEMLRTSHSREMEQLQAQHDRERDMIAAEAAAEAQRQADERARTALADAPEPKTPLLLQALNDYGDVIQPLVGEGMAMLMDYVQRRRAAAKATTIAYGGHDAPNVGGQQPYTGGQQPYPGQQQPYPTQPQPFPGQQQPYAHQQPSSGHHQPPASQLSAVQASSGQPASIRNGTYAGIQP